MVVNLYHNKMKDKKYIEMDFKPVTLKTVESEIIPFGTLNPNFNGYNQISGSNLKFTVAQRRSK